MPQNVNTPLPSPIGGVSQQPRHLRLDTQGKRMVNGWSSPVDGLVKRWASDHVAKLEEGPTSASPFIHGINRDAQERYVLKLSDLRAKVYGLDGTSYPVYGPDGTTPDFSYLDTAPTGPNLLEDPYDFELFPTGNWTVGAGGFADIGQPVQSEVLGPLGRPSVVLKAATGVPIPGFARWAQTNGTFSLDGTSQVAYFYFNVADAVLPPEQVAIVLEDSVGANTWETEYDVFTEIATVDAGATGGVIDLDNNWKLLWVSVQSDSATAPDPANARRVFVELRTSTVALEQKSMLATSATLLDGYSEPLPYEPIDYEDSYKALTVADYTFIVNRTRTVEMLPDLSTGGTGKAAAEYGEGLIFVRQPLNCAHYYTRIQTFTPNEYRAGLWTRGTRPATPLGSTELCGEINAHTSDIASTIQARLGVASPGLTVEEMEWSGSSDPSGDFDGGPVLYVAGEVGDVLSSMECWCDKSDNAITAVFGQVDDISDLPTMGVQGIHVAVLGDQEEGGDDYYVHFEGKLPTSDKIQDGYWVETRKLGIQYKFDPSSMPHQLIRKQDDSFGTVTGTPFQIYFEFGPSSWEDREVGDEDTNPNPTFVGRTINDVFFHANRLGFISDQNVILSESGAYFNFWRTSITGGVLDSDRIDIAASTTNVTIFQHAIEFESTLLLFSDRAQFTLTGDPSLTPATAEIRTVFHYETYTGASPLAVGRGVLFPFKKGDYSGVREMLRVGDDEFTEIDITSQVPAYIDGPALRIEGTPLEDVAIVLTKTKRDTLYVYKWFWVGSEKVQSAWSEWTFEGADIRDAFFIENRIYIVAQREDGLYLECMEVSTALRDSGLDFQIRLDRRAYNDSLSLTYNGDTDTTAIGLPWTMQGDEVYLNAETGIPLERTDVNLLFAGDLTETPIVVGFNYEFLWEFGEIVLRSSRGGNDDPAQGRWQLNRGIIEYADTAYFEVSVIPNLGTAKTYQVAPRLGSEVTLDVVTLESGEFSFPIQQRAEKVDIQIKSTSYLPVRILRTEWEGHQSARSSGYAG